MRKSESLNRYPKAMGRSYEDKRSEVVLRVGRRTWTREQMVSRLHCVEFKAAKRYLTPALKKMHVTSVRQIAGMNAARFWRREGIGLSCMYILMSLIQFDLKRDAERWVMGESEDLVTLATMRRREQKREQSKRSTHTRDKGDNIVQFKKSKAA